MADERWLETRRLALEAAALILVARVALAIVPIATLRRWLESQQHAAQPESGAAAATTASRIGGVVAAVARRLPRTTCLVQAVAVKAMLRRRGIPSSLRIGVRTPRGAPAFDAHAWLECAGTVVVGDTVDIAEYTVFSSPM